MGARWLTEEQYEAHQAKVSANRANGGFARAAILTPERRKEIAIEAAKARWIDKPARKAPVTRSELEAELQRQIEAAELPPPRYDVPYLIGSRCRADVLFEAGRLVVEVQGGCHVVRAKAHADIRKAAESLLQGWRLLPVDRDAIYSGQALTWIIQLLKPG
jgi:very-short-patch-repair endonuclease